MEKLFPTQCFRHSQTILFHHKFHPVSKYTRDDSSVQKAVDLINCSEVYEEKYYPLSITVSLRLWVQYNLQKLSLQSTLSIMTSVNSLKWLLTSAISVPHLHWNAEDLHTILWKQVYKQHKILIWTQVQNKLLSFL